MSIVAEHTQIRSTTELNSINPRFSLPQGYLHKEEGLGDLPQVDTGQKIGCAFSCNVCPGVDIVLVTQSHICPPQAPAHTITETCSILLRIVPLCLEGNVILLYKKV